jgi:hypothetical protein
MGSLFWPEGMAEMKSLLPCGMFLSGVTLPGFPVFRELPIRGPVETMSDPELSISTTTQSKRSRIRCS